MARDAPQLNHCAWCGITLANNLKVCWYCTDYEILLQQWYEGREMFVPSTP